MVARKRTKKATKKKARRPPPEKYKEHYPGLLITLVVECGLVNRQGEIAWKRIAKVMNASVPTLTNWRNPQSKYYHSEFRLAALAARAAVESNAIKHSMILRAKGYIRVKKTVTVSETEEGEFTSTRTEREKMHGDVAAAKLCLANMGSEEERWTDKADVSITDKRTSLEECQQVADDVARARRSEMNLVALDSDHPAPEDELFIPGRPRSSRTSSKSSCLAASRASAKSAQVWIVTFAPRRPRTTFKPSRMRP